MDDIKEMITCVYCNRELKSPAGKVRHESFCKAREISGQTEEEINAIIEGSTPKEESTEVVVHKPKVVQLEVMGGAETYYDGHPRRLTKLKGMLSATFDRTERHKIQQLILKVENETYKG